MKRQVNLRMSEATFEKLQELRDRYGTQTETIAIAIDRLFWDEIAQYDRTEHKAYFWRHVKKLGPDDCWEWTAGKLKTGYGIARGRPEKGPKQIYAHRYSYELHHGPIPDGKLICHKCNNPSCVNPNHLYAGTPKQNAQDMMRAGNRYQPDGKGEKNARSILSKEDVLQIRQRLQDGESATSVAKDYPVSKTTIKNIRNRKTWKHI